MIDGNGTQQELGRELGSLEAKVDILIKGQDALFHKVNSIEKDVSALNVKAGIWGTISGLLAGVGAAFGFKMTQ